MALRDQPYLPLYVQDYLTDEKLNECSAATQGVYVKIMCIMHKSDQYGTILLKQKYKQTSSMSLSFATQLANHLPFTVDVLQSAISELLEEKVCQIDGDMLCQKRMITDNDISIKRSNSGKKGGMKTQSKHKDFALAKPEANSENENEYENEDKVISFSFKKELLKIGVKKQNAIDFIKNRRVKKLANTETAFKAILTEINKRSGNTANECIEQAAKRGWGGFKASWEWSDEEPTQNKGLA
jgi:hypothetical protein